MADTFHQAAITRNHICIVINKLIAKERIFMTLCHRHANRIRNTLAKRPGCGFDTCGMTIFRMASCFGAPLTE